MSEDRRGIVRRTLSQWLSAHAGAVILAAIGALTIGFCLAVVAQEAKPAIPHDAEYVTSKLCGMCHKDEKAVFATTPHGNHQPPADTDEPWKHSTGWNPETGEAAEAGVACEACHGRGSAHAKAKAEERKGLIINPLGLETNSQRVSICAQCHSRYTVPEGAPPASFTPGEDLLAKVTLLPPEDGQSMQQVNELVGSKHFENELGCIQCHTSHSEGIQEHQLRKPIDDLCVQCHQDQSDIAAHTSGEAEQGDTCATCHMPNGSHAFTKPLDE